MTKATKSPKRSGLWVNVKQCSGLILLLALALVVAFGILPRTWVMGDSMDTTIHHKQSLVTMGVKLNPFIKLKRGDIVVAYADEVKALIIKRLIALPGDRLEITDNCVYVNGQKLDEPYINGSMTTPDIPCITLGEDEYFLMGDNRNVSLDSRHIGAVKHSRIWSIVYLEHQVVLNIVWVSWVLLVCILAYLYVRRMESKEDDSVQECADVETDPVLT